MAKSVIPRQFLIRHAFRCKYIAKLPKTGAHPLDLPKECRLPFPGAMDGEAQYADVRTAWNEAGFAIQWEVHGKKERPYGEPDRPGACDGLALWLDTRDTRTIHRASRFCQRFFLLATTEADKLLPTVQQKSIHRALEDAPTGDLSAVRIAFFGVDEDGDTFEPDARRKVTDYRVEAFIPAANLNGFDVETSSRLGICYHIRDRELGNQILAAGMEFPFWEDPSLWSVLELVR